MPFLGEALARHLLGLRGLYSVQLPDGLRNELVTLVSTINGASSRRAVFVTDSNIPDVLTSKWAEVLKWRTDDDRIFAWERGAGEPDTSFQSAVREFIGPRFPLQGSLCDRDALAEIAVRFLFESRNTPSSGPFFDAFLSTAKWVAQIYELAFEELGNVASSQWTDRFLVQWAAFCDALPGVLDRAEVHGYHARFAWELLRVAGLIVPTPKTAGSPFMLDPTDALPTTERAQRDYVRAWQDVVREFVVSPGQLPVLLNELDRQVPGVGGRTPWRGLNWSGAESFDTDAPATSVGRAVFLGPSSLSVIGSVPPTYPVAPTGAWWGVTQEQLTIASDAVDVARPIQPQPAAAGLGRLLGASNAYLLETRTGNVSYPSTAKKWRCAVKCGDIRLEFRESWNRLFVSSTEPTGAAEADAWIDPASIALDAGRGVDCTVTDAQSVGNILYLTCTIDVTCSTSIDVATQQVSGAWEPYRVLTLSLRVRDRLEPSFSPPRELKSRMDLVVPSPFAPTVVVVDRKIVVSPSNSDQFGRNATATTWQAANTPEVQLEDERKYAVSVYEGTIEIGTGAFVAPTAVLVGGNVLPSDATSNGLAAASCDLEEGTVVARLGTGQNTEDLAVVRIREDKTAAVSSGILAVLQGRTAGRRPPSTQATGSLLGRAQTAVVHGVAGKIGGQFESLFHVVVPSNSPTTAWPARHPATRVPLLLGAHSSLALPGIGEGPQRIFETASWASFKTALELVCAAIGIAPDAQTAWLSAFDPTAIPSSLVRQYNDAHSELVIAAKRISAAEAFWAAYPFSVMVVDGEQGRNFGRLQAVLLSPLHPVRLSWLHGVALFAQEIHGASGAAQEMLGLVEGWNIPLVGSAPTPTERSIPLVAVPLDPGHERDFIGWSALAVLTNNVVEIPASATGLPLPWAGRSGINDKVVTGALTDYLNVSPYVGSLVVDLRSVARAPRSAEIDQAVLEFLNDASEPLVAALPGGARIFDSSYREGDSPRRDELLNLRGEAPGNEVAFEWRSYPANDVPTHADVAFVENASVSLDVVDGATPGFIGPLAIRRLLPADNATGRMDQNFVPPDGEDVLGLARLLRQIECTALDAVPLALRASPSLQTLGIAKGGKWEVIGTFNLSPRLLALTLARASDSDRLLWEWRPSWLNPEKQGHADPSRRPYFVIARIPASLSAGLGLRQGLTTEQINRLISELGRRAVGLATLYAAGETHESAAAGFFYALQALGPSNVPLAAAWHRPAPWMESIIAIDPVAELLQAMADKKFARRADLLAVGCVCEDSGVHICLTPIEVKHHGSPANPQGRPDDSDSELKRAREQLKQTRELLESVRSALPAVDRPMVATGRRLALSVLVDFALDFANRSPSAAERAEILNHVLRGRCSVSLGTPCLFWFAPGSIALNGTAFIRGQHGVGDNVLHEAYIDPYAVPALWWDGIAPRADDHQARNGVDQLMTDAVSTCVRGGDSVPDLEAALRTALGITVAAIATAPASATAAQPTPAATPESPSAEVIPAPIEQASRAAASTPGAPVDAAPPSVTTPEAAPATVMPLTSPSIVVGAREVGARWSIIGKLSAGAQDPVALDLDQPKVMGIFGYMGSGKSYLAGVITEAAVEPLENINSLAAPLAVVVFNYRRNASDRFELSSLAFPNQNGDDVERLHAEFNAVPTRVRDLEVLALRGELTAPRLAEYAGIQARELLFRPADLTVEDWELLMGQPGRERVYAQAIRHALIDLRDQGDVSVGSLRQRITQFAGASRPAADQRLTFAARHLSDTQGVNFAEVLKPGRIVIVDLRQPLFNRDDALRFFLVCANQISRVQGRFNKLVVFDEAHEYLSDAFGEKLESRIRQMRHEGTSYVFATQDVGSIPKDVQRFMSTKFVFGLGSRQNVDDLMDFSPEFRGFDPLEVAPGTCFVQATISSRNFFAHPKLVKVRPRVTAHGGATRIFA